MYSENNIQNQNADKERIRTLLDYWTFMGDGAGGADIKNKNDVRLMQEVLGASGLYKGEKDGKYTSVIAQARRQWLSTIIQDPNFAWELIKFKAQEAFAD